MSLQPPPPPTSRPSSSGALRPVLPTTPSSSSSRSHQSGAITQHWNDLPHNMTPTSRSVSPNSLSSTASSSAAEFPQLVTTLFTATPTTLQVREAEMLYDRLVKKMDSITETQKAELADVIKRVAIERSETPVWGREKLVEFITRERGVAGWAGGLRRGVECVNYTD